VITALLLAVLALAWLWSDEKGRAQLRRRDEFREKSKWRPWP